MKKELETTISDMYQNQSAKKIFSLMMFCDKMQSPLAVLTLPLGAMYFTVQLTLVRKKLGLS
jgi:hypothetical protein